MTNILTIEQTDCGAKKHYFPHIFPSPSLSHMRRVRVRVANQVSVKAKVWGVGRGPAGSQKERRKWQMAGLFRSAF